MRGFEQIPNDLVTDRRLSIGARALYPLLRQLAWSAGRRDQEDAVPLPTIADIAETLGTATSTTSGYVAELRDNGWIETIRANRRRPLLWVIRDSASTPESGGLADSEYTEKRVPSTPESGDPSYVLPYVVDKPLPDEPGEDVPDEVFTLRFEVELALTAELGIEPNGMTSRERGQWGVAVAELVNAGATAGQVAERCAAYRALGWKLTPMALVKHWAMLGAEATAKTSGFDGWLEQVTGRFDRATAHELVEDTPSLDDPERRRRHRAVDERFDEIHETDEPVERSDAA